MRNEATLTTSETVKIHQSPKAYGTGGKRSDVHRVTICLPKPSRRRRSEATDNITESVSLKNKYDALPSRSSFQHANASRKDDEKFEELEKEKANRKNIAV